MPDWLSIHEPVLVNTIGHCAGAVIFGILLYFFFVNWRRTREKRSSLPVLATPSWPMRAVEYLGSLVALATGPGSGMVANWIVAASFSVLSLLPARSVAHLPRIPAPDAVDRRLSSQPDRRGASHRRSAHKSPAFSTTPRSSL